MSLRAIFLAHAGTRVSNDGTVKGYCLVCGHLATLSSDGTLVCETTGCSHEEQERAWLEHDLAASTEVEREASGVGGPSTRAESLGRRLRSLPVAEVRPERVRWLWEGRVPLGTLTLLAGRQGLGKSTLTAEIAAQLSRGELPGELEGTPVATLLVSYEDHVASTIAPRLMAAGADLTMVHVVTAERDGDVELVSLPEDTERIAVEAKARGARLVVVDPVVASLPAGEVNAHRDQDVRRALAPLARLAEECDLAVVGTIHFNKAPGVDVIGRTSGSIAFTAAARSVLAFGADPSDADGEHGTARVLAHAKSNLGPLAPSLGCSLEGREVIGEETIQTARLVIGEECEARASELLTVPNAEDRSEAEEAVEFLTEQLASGEARPSREVKGAASAAGISKRTLERATKSLGVVVDSGGFPRRTTWQLSRANDSGAIEGELPGATSETRIAKRNPVHPDAQSRHTPICGATDGNGWTSEAADRFLESAKLAFPGASEEAA